MWEYFPNNNSRSTGRLGPDQPADSHRRQSVALLCATRHTHASTHTHDAPSSRIEALEVRSPDTCRAGRESQLGESAQVERQGRESLGTRAIATGCLDASPMVIVVVHLSHSSTTHSPAIHVLCVLYYVSCILHSFNRHMIDGHASRENVRYVIQGTRYKTQDT